MASASSQCMSWANEVLPLATEPFAQVDVDEFGVTGAKTVRRSLDLFAEMATVRQRGVDVVLAVPLAPSTRLETRVSTWESLLRRSWSGLEIPGIYLTQPGWIDQPDEVEEYRRPVSCSTVVATEGTRCLYRAFRSLDERRRGWEFTRVVYVVAGASDS